jgi:hypothetical protein
MIKLMIALVFSFSLHASSDDLFCTRTSLNISEYLGFPSSRISFKNDGGLFNGGVCWWHSRLQRSSAYLVKFAPAKARPSSAQAALILKALREMNQVVEIGGYENFNDFTKDNKPLVQKMLNEWQKIDGFFNMQWVRGISGASKLSPGQLEYQMKRVFDFYKSSPVPLWVMAQIKGITSHAFLVVDMVTLPRGFDLTVIDSNYPSLNFTLHYQFGDTTLVHPKSKTKFVPYVGFQRDYQLISGALKNYCHVKNLSELDQVPEGDVEVSYSTESPAVE